jgi:hypothetical protein
MTQGTPGWTTLARGEPLPGVVLERTTAHLVATAWVGPSGDVVVCSEIPLNLTAARPEQELNVQLHVDHRQWCVRAKTAGGGASQGPLFWSMHALSGTGGSSFSDPRRIDASTWAGYWGQSPIQSSGRLEVSLWVGGANYATTRVEASAP